LGALVIDLVLLQVDPLVSEQDEIMVLDLGHLLSHESDDTASCIECNIVAPGFACASTWM
jgi:hypothetical protein